MFTMKIAIVFIDKSFKTKIYQLERYAIKRFAEPDSYKLIYFNDKEWADKFVRLAKAAKSEDEIKSLIKAMLISICLVRDYVDVDKFDEQSNIKNNLQNNDINFKTRFIKEQNVENNTLQNSLQLQEQNEIQKQESQYMNLGNDNYNILDEIEEKLKKQETVSRQRLISIDKLDQKYQNYLHYYPKNLQAVQIIPEKLYTLYFDGASKKNPGPAGAGIVLYQNLQQINQISAPLGIQTNNVAEFISLFYGIRYSLSVGINDLECFGDSKLIIDGMNNKIKFKLEHLENIRQIVEKYSKLLRSVKYKHIPRNQNKIADKLSVEAAEISKKKNEDIVKSSNN